MQIANRKCTAFTLVEVLVAIAIALVLIVGISQIFSMAEQTTGAGQALLTDIAKQRTIQQTLAGDLGSMVTGPDSPCIAIASYPIAAFRNKQDMMNNRAGSTPPNGGPLYFDDPAGTGSLPPASNLAAQPYSVNSRVHRVDRICFFARDLYRRQTADAPHFASPTTSTEAFVWLGHLTLPNNAEIGDWDPTQPSAAIPSSRDPADHQPAWFAPGAPGDATHQNDNNNFASDWILGREVTLLVPAPTAGRLTESGMVSLPGAMPLSLGVSNNPGQSVASSGGPYPPSIPIFASRYDVAYTNIAACRRLFSGTGGGFRARFNYSTTCGQDLSGVGLGTPFSLPPAPPPPGIGIMKDQRYYANPYPTKPAAYPASASASDAAYWMSAAAAQTSPIFVRGCSQFIVEYAGNFLQQNQDASPTNSNFGQITGVGPDPTGKLDFIPVTYVDANGNKIYARQIRWYGFPRDVDGDGNVLAYSGDGAKNLSDYQGSPGHAAPDVPTTFDVVPLYNVIQSAVPALPPKQVMPRPFEQAYPVNYTSMLGPGSIPFNTASTTNPPEANPYVCVWGPGTPAAQMPKMIRIIIGIDDPSGRLNSEQTYEYVFTLP